LNSQEPIVTIFGQATENSLSSALIGAFLIAAATKIIAWAKRWRDGQRVVKFLRLSNKETSFQFRSTSAIAAATKLTELRVEDICSAHPEVIRNTEQKQSWRAQNE
jgi:hypothetical protein